MSVQELTVVKIHSHFELYCDKCDSLFDKDMFLENIDYFLDIHRHIHSQMGLDTPDFDKNEELYTELSTDIT